MPTKKDIFPLRLSISHLSEEERKHSYVVQKATHKWKEIEVEDNETLRKVLSTFPYGVYSYNAIKESELPMVEVKGKDGKVRTRKESQRLKKYASHVNTTLTVLDIDDTLSIEAAKHRLDSLNLKYAIITTKSHGIKGDSDRFRILLPYDFNMVNSLVINPKLIDEKSAKWRNKLAENYLGGYVTTMEVLAQELFWVKGTIQEDVLNHQTGEITKVEKEGFVCPVDFAPLAPPGKFYPSLPTSEFFSTLDDEQRDVFDFNTLPGLKEKVYEEIRNRRKREEEKEISMRTAQLNAKGGTYEWFKGRKEYPVLTNEPLLKSLDMKAIIYHYEYQDDNNSGSRIELKTAGSDDLVHISGSDGACYHINHASDGAFVFFDYNTGRKGSIVEYMFDKFPFEFSQEDKTKSPYHVAKKIAKDFKADMPDVVKDLIIGNPAFYIEPYLELLSKKAGSIKETRAAICERTKIKSFGFSKKESSLVVTNLKGYKNNFVLEDEVYEEIMKAEEALTAPVAYEDNPSVDSQPSP